MTLIVAVSMEKHFVPQIVVVAVAIEMIDLHDVSILEVQFTPATFALLVAKQARFRLMHQWMSLEALAPVQRVPIVGTGHPLHLGVSLDRGRAVPAQCCVLGSRKHPFALPYAMPVFLDHPTGSFAAMSTYRPTHQLSPYHMVTAFEGPRCVCCFVVGSPSPDDGVEVCDHFLLRGGSQPAQVWFSGDGM